MEPTGAPTMTLINHMIYNYEVEREEAYVADSGVGRIHKDDLVVLVCRVVVHPVRVEHSKATTRTSNTLLSERAQVLRGLEVVDTLVDRLSIHDSLQSTSTSAPWPFAT